MPKIVTWELGLKLKLLVCQLIKLLTHHPFYIMFYMTGKSQQTQKYSFYFEIDRVATDLGRNNGWYVIVRMFCVENETAVLSLGVLLVNVQIGL